MNTGKIIETDRLILRPGKNNTDDEPFITMLRREDGDFKDFCGFDFCERYLEGFRNYFELDNNCIYSIYPRTTERFIGYVGVHCEPKCSDYEIEFYIARDERRKGYCFEASTALIDQFFNKSLSINNNSLTVSELYATVLPDNMSAINTLSKLDFVPYKPEDGPIVLGEGFIDEETDEFVGYFCKKYILYKAGKS